MGSLGKIIRTVSHLRFRQIYFRIYYKIGSVFSRIIKNKSDFNKRIVVRKLKLSPFIRPDNILINNTLNFLNRSKIYTNSLNWEDNQFGLLWAFNLNYFDFLNQINIEKDEGLALIKDFIFNYDDNSVAKHSYTISLRGINWIKFVSIHNIQDIQINSHLFNQYQLLVRRPEYPLMGNHLLENGLSLLFGAVYFNNKYLMKKSKSILLKELEEQILEDGAHFELSTMYHIILLNRLLDCINLLSNNSSPEYSDLEILLREKASLMVSWMNNMTLSNGILSDFNDSTSGVAPSVNDIMNYAKTLEICPVKELRLGSSGYRFYRKNTTEFIFDVGNIGPDYQPAHAHSDTFNFEWYISSKPIIVDTGTSTYENNEIRRFERSTRAHNTIEVDGGEQSEIWHSFRVGRRAKTKIIMESENHLIAVHNGYDHIGAVHQREYLFQDDKIEIKDSIKSAKKP